MAHQPHRPDNPATSGHGPARPGQVLPRTARKAAIDRLARPAMRADLAFTGLAVVSAVRLLAISVRCGRDPLEAQVQQFGCLETTRAFMEFADLAGRSWPDRVNVLRPCCLLLSPDEWTLAQLAERALAGDRAGFSRQIDGFIRADRHDRLFDAAAHLAALLQRCALAGRAAPASGSR